MSSDHRHCDDALQIPSDAPQVDPRQGGYFVDDETLLEWSEESADEDEIDNGYDDDRVEDEDWEIAEGGMLIKNKDFRALDRISNRFYKAI
jgi:hypothetical protein